MKKLFLYTAIIIYVFWSVFIIFHDIYKNKKYKYEIATTEQNIVYEDSERVQAVPSSYDDTNIYDNIGALSEYSFDDKSMPLYTVGIKDNAVVVYDKDDEVFEYTGIDASLIQSLNPPLYDRLKSGVTFGSVEELYVFLESISS